MANLTGQASPTERPLIQDANAPLIGEIIEGVGYNVRSFQATLTGNGALTATVLIQVSLDGTNWMTMHTIALSGTNYATDGVSSTSSWTYTRANLTEISGTGAKVNVLMGF